MDSFCLYNGFKIPCIGYGTFPIKEKLLELIPIAYNNGYRLFDTSDNYNNEKFVGKSVSDFYQDYTIITKFSQPYKTNNLCKCFLDSKKNCINADIYLLHWPYPFLWKQQWHYLEQLYIEGKCKAIGVCNFDKKNLSKLLKICKVKPMINQIELHPFFQQKDIVSFCQDNSIQVMAYSPFARRNFQFCDNTILKNIARKYNKEVNQIILRWDIQKNVIPIPSSASELHIQSNIDIFNFTLSEEEILAIDSLDMGMRVRFDPKKRFSLKQKIIFFVKAFLHI